MKIKEVAAEVREVLESEGPRRGWSKLGEARYPLWTEGFSGTRFLVHGAVVAAGATERGASIEVCIKAAFPLSVSPPIKLLPQHAALRGVLAEFETYQEIHEGFEHIKDRPDFAAYRDIFMDECTLDPEVTSAQAEKARQLLRSCSDEILASPVFPQVDALGVSISYRSHGVRWLQENRGEGAPLLAQIELAATLATFDLYGLSALRALPDVVENASVAPGALPSFVMYMPSRIDLRVEEYEGSISVLARTPNLCGPTGEDTATQSWSRDEKASGYVLHVTSDFVAFRWVRQIPPIEKLLVDLRQLVQLAVSLSSLGTYR